MPCPGFRGAIRFFRKVRKNVAFASVPEDGKGAARRREEQSMCCLGCVDRRPVNPAEKGAVAVEGFRRRGVIKVNEKFEKNQIYVLPEDYDFVWNFVKENCPQAKIK